MAKKADNKAQGSGGDQGGRSKGSSNKSKAARAAETRRAELKLYVQQGAVAGN